LPQAAEGLAQRFPQLRFVRVGSRADCVRVYGGNPSELLEAVLGYARESQVEVASVNSVKPSLEDAFVQLTGLSPEVMLAEKGGR
jgi:ABC-2 type transport system ATP-binding protein